MKVWLADWLYRQDNKEWFIRANRVNRFNRLACRIVVSAHGVIPYSVWSRGRRG